MRYLSYLQGKDDNSIVKQTLATNINIQNQKNIEIQVSNKYQARNFKVVFIQI